MGIKHGRHHDAGEFLIEVISRIHLEIRKPFFQRTPLIFPFHNDSKINLILSTAKADWNNNMMCDRVSPIMENFYFQLKCEYKCSTIHDDGTRCDGTDIKYEIHQYLLLQVNASTIGDAKIENPPNILQLLRSSFSKTA